MLSASQLDSFIKGNGDHIFIEAEGKLSTLTNFFMEYNSSYSPEISKNADGIIFLDESANKWGLELRLYLNYSPNCDGVTKNTVYRSEYPYRINDNNLIKEMFTLGYRIGAN